MDILGVYRTFTIQKVTCNTSHIILSGKMDPDWSRLPKDVTVQLTDGTEVKSVNLHLGGKGGTTAGYGILHQPDGTGVMEFDLSQPIDPNEVAAVKLDDTTISLTETTAE